MASKNNALIIIEILSLLSLHFMLGITHKLIILSNFKLLRSKSCRKLSSQKYFLKYSQHMKPWLRIHRGQPPASASPGGQLVGPHHPLSYTINLDTHQIKLICIFVLSTALNYITFSESPGATVRVFCLYLYLPPCGGITIGPSSRQHTVRSAHYIWTFWLTGKQGILVPELV